MFVQKPLTCVEICAGAGGQALGLAMAGFVHVALVEYEADYCNTLKQNRPEWNVICADVRNFDGKPYEGVDLLAGGVPCPPFSIAGKQLGKDDERDLFPEALRLIKEISMYCEMHNDVALFYNEPLVEHTCNFFASKKVFSRTQGSCVLVPVKIDIRPVNCIVKNKDNVIENNIYRDTANYIIFGKSYGYMKKTLSHKNEQMDFLEYYNYKYGLVDSGLENVIMVHPYFEFSNTFELTYNDLFPLKMLQFENMLLPVPNNYDYLLKELYGDYMSYPNICHRAPVACQIYQRQLKDNRFNLCLSMFKHTNRGLLYRMRIILVQIRLLGVFEYMKIKIYE